MERADEQIGVADAREPDHSGAMDTPGTLSETLLSIETFSIKCWLYLPSEVSWTLDSPSLVLESEEVRPEQESDPDAGVPEIARQLNMMQALSIAEVQDAVANAKSQKPDVSVSELFDAFLYYYDNDAYMKL